MGYPVKPADSAAQKAPRPLLSQLDDAVESPRHRRHWFGHPPKRLPSASVLLAITHALQARVEQNQALDASERARLSQLAQLMQAAKPSGLLARQYAGLLAAMWNLDQHAVAQHAPVNRSSSFIGRSLLHPSDEMVYGAFQTGGHAAVEVPQRSPKAVPTALSTAAVPPSQIFVAQRKQHLSPANAAAVIAFARFGLGGHPAAQAYLQRGRLRTAELAGAQDNYIVTNMIIQGGFAKLRHGLRKSTRTMVALRELRLGSCAAANDRKTHITTPEQHDNELRVMQGAHAVLQPEEIIYDRHKVYWVMPLACGDLWQASGAIVDAQQRSHIGHLMLSHIGCQAHALHASGHIHCDLKVENILFLADGACVLADYGHAQAAAKGDKGYIQGSPEFLPLSALIGGRAEASLDVWSLGVCYVAIMLQRLPFGAYGSLHTRLHAVRRDLVDYERWSAGPDVNENGGWGAVVRQLEAHDAATAHFVFNHMLCVDPAARATMQQVAAAMACHPCHAHLIAMARQSLAALGHNNPRRLASHAALTAHACFAANLQQAARPAYQT